MSAMESQITGLSIVCPTVYPFIQAQIKENIQAPRHWPLWGESTGDWWIPLTKASNAEIFSLIPQVTRTNNNPRQWSMHVPRPPFTNMD